MNLTEINCARACRNTCALLNDALNREGELTAFYDQVKALCDYPDIQSFLVDFSNQHQKMIDSLKEKLGEMKARSQALDGVISSFDPAGC